MEPSGSRPPLSAVVAGHICLDVLPGLEQVPHGQFQSLFQPGKLLIAGPVTFSTGGAVSNTGLSMHRLGVPTRLVAKVGADHFGDVVLEIVRSFGPGLDRGVVVDPQAATSYSIILSPPGVDRIILHCPGANDAFTAADVDDALVADSALFHFGYPPIMRQMYCDGGQQLAQVLRRAKQAGATTSLDLAFPDPASEAAQADWPAIFRAALPFVDIFVPSFEELLFLLRREQYRRLSAAAGERGVLSMATPELLSDLSDELFDLGVKVLLLKLGEHGAYLRTAKGIGSQNLGRAFPDGASLWEGQELWAPCFQVKVAGTVGSGDSTIAGFLSALLRGLPPPACLQTAVAVGACNVEAIDTLSGVPTWETLQMRLSSPWPRLPLALPGWSWKPEDGVFRKE